MSDQRATSFGARAAEYESGRPGYPDEAVSWMLDPLPQGRRRIADIGAGTGKLTRALVRMPGAEVIAIDPDAAMLDALRTTVPGVPALLGRAETLPAGDETLDAAVLGQAWHWADPDAASVEIGRAVRSGGVLGLVWNLRDERVEWVRRLADIMRASPAEGMFVDGGGPRVSAPFGPLQQRVWEWSRPMTRPLLHRMADSRSHVITASGHERRTIHRELDALFDDLGLRDGDEVDLPYVTRAFRAIRA